MTQGRSLVFYDQPLEPDDATAQVLEGLTQAQKRISPKFFYDERGSELFTRITRQPEYYPTRTEIAIIKAARNELRALTREPDALIEYGSGSSEKIRLLLESVRPKVYAPLDISRDYLARSAESIAQDFPWLEVRATCIDYTADFELPFDPGARKVGFFPGSSIGNFSRPAAREFLARVRDQLGAQGALVIGVDMKKDEEVLNRAYNDAAGVTAAFNLNVLTHLNREFDADFVEGNFEHFSRYNPDEGCVQMFLISRCDQTVIVAGEAFDFAEGERIHTENSHKYGKQEFLDMASLVGFAEARVWQDDNEWFSVFYLTAE